ncbi:tetratricopeptide repeat protein [Tenacibaculum jejuense]|uniref:Uncharacterized protein n=1 Tax=Tenacibaculum jejuense TaxID=584609 RepID=A0A238U8Y2_9FLAO|nr:tetratricopeptide repeat protein [Tenacibaculum jejuense]SNR15649.1 exported protein of unknown function [Tenacibaculum jejuense]
MKRFFMLIFSLIILQAFSQNADPEKLAELNILGQAIDSTLFNNNYEFFDTVFDEKLLANRFFIKTDDNDIKKFNSGFFKGFSESFSFGKELSSQINLGSEYTYLRAFKENDNYYLLFRLFGESGLNYHKHLIEYVKDQPKISDTYVYISGEYLSETVKSIYEGGMKNRNLLSRILNKSNISDLEKLAKMKVYKDQNKYKETIKTYESLSETSKKRKIFMIYVLMAAKNLDNKTYMNYIRDYEKEYPNDPSLYLISMDGFILKQEYDKALEVLDKLDKAIGNDDFLDYFRGNAYYLKKDYNKAIEKFERLIVNYPNFFDGIDSLLTVYIENSKNEKAITILDLFVERFEIEKESLKKLVKENFTDFTKSKEYKNWSNQ